MPSGPRNVALREIDLYPPLREYLTRQGYNVKGEVERCDLVAVRGQEPPLVVELKTRLNLELVLQAADRLSLTDSVYLAFPAQAPLWRRHFRRVRALCRRLGLGIITLDGSDLRVNVRLDPLPYQPRGSKSRQHRLLAEFERRVGDPNLGGVTGQPLMTAYRQDALRCVAALTHGSCALADIRQGSRVPHAARILQKNHYGWFERIRRGHYRLSPKGVTAASHYEHAIKELGLATDGSKPPNTAPKRAQRSCAT